MKILGRWAETIYIFSRMAVAGRRSSLINESENLSVHGRYKVDGSLETRDLYLSNFENNKSVLLNLPIFFDFSGSQSIEAGIEEPRQFWILLFSWVSWPRLKAGNRFGGLAPITDSVGTVEEMRYEYFAIHNWSINSRMTLETTFLFEDSTISQTGSKANSRDFNFFRPKIDYRFDITPSFQFRATVKKTWLN